MKLLIITQKVDENDQLLGFFIDWIRRFAGNFEKVNIFCLERGSFNLPENVKVKSLGKDRGLPKIVWLCNFYKYSWQQRSEYDAVFVHMNPIWAVFGSFWWHLLSKKVFLWYTHKAVTFKLKLAEKFVDVIFTASKESFRLPSKKIIITGHGIDTDLFRPNPELKVYDGAVRILSVGRIAPVKNYETLIEAAKILDNQKINFSVTIIGEPALEKDKSYEKKIRSRIENLGLEKRFEFLGKVIYKNIMPYYQSHDIFMHLSKTGSLDKTLLEAIACGMRVISSNDSAKAFLPPELFLDNEDPLLLARRIKELINKNYDIQKLRNYVAENHGLSNLIRKISEILTASPRKRILVSSYTYVDKDYLKTFDYYPHGASDLYFLVPAVWPIKKGIYVYKPPKQENVQSTKAFFVHSNYPIIGGTLKGWMPMFPLVVAKQRPDIVFSVSEPNLLTALYQGIFAKLFRAKHIILIWENLPYTKFKGLNGLIQRAIVKLNIRFCDGFVCGTRRTQSLIQSLIQSLTSRRTVVLPSTGMDTDYFKRDYPRQVTGYTDQVSPITFSFIGAIDYRKGVHLIIEAFAELVKTMTNIQLIVAGKGNYEQEIDQMIKAAGLSNLVTRIPWLDRDGVRKVLNKSDAFLYPSISHKGWEEQFGFALLEASLMKLPIITTKSGSIPEVVLDGKTGILIEPNDVKALENAMAILAKDEQLRIRMGKAGRQFVCDNFSYEVIAKKFYGFFNDI